MVITPQGDPPGLVLTGNIDAADLEALRSTLLHSTPCGAVRVDLRQVPFLLLATVRTLVRTAGEEEGIEHALKTHPADVRGVESIPSLGYVDPFEYAHACDSVPLSERPADADVLPLRGDLNAVRRFIVGRAMDLGLTEELAAMLTVAVGETPAFLRDDGHVALWTCAWATASRGLPAAHGGPEVRGARSLVAPRRPPAGPQPGSGS